MRKAPRWVVSAVALSAWLGGAWVLPATAADAETLKLGKALAFDVQKGNCLACHMMGDGESPGDIGPPLVAMQARFPDKAKLRAQVYDPTLNNPNTRMPPFGKHKIVTDLELDAIVEYLYTL